MTVKTITLPNHPTLTQVRFGRHIPRVHPQTLRLGNYLKAGLPAAPPTSNFTAKGGSVLRDILGNDKYGCCVLSCGGHEVGTETGNAGSLFPVTTAEVLTQYTAITGFNPNDPNTDQGTNIIDALNYWKATGTVNGTKILGYLSIDPTNKAEVQAAMWLFENIVFGVALPDSYVNPFPSGDGFIWDVDTPDPSNGHCFLGVGHDASGIDIDTWGLFGTFTYAAIAALCSSSGGGEIYVILTPDQIAKGAAKAPNGVAWADIISDFNSIGGNVPVPAPPAPVPAPPPLPGTAPTAAQAISWAQAGIPANSWLLTRQQALTDIATGITKHWPK
jgi:hypothetical protein